MVYIGCKLLLERHAVDSYQIRLPNWGMLMVDHMFLKQRKAGQYNLCNIIVNSIIYGVLDDAKQGSMICCDWHSSVSGVSFANGSGCGV